MIGRKAEEVAGFCLAMTIIKKIKWRFGNTLRDFPKLTFSHIGEDVFLHHIVRNFANGKRISWLDIGASYPIVGNNFFAFSMKFLLQSKTKSGVKMAIDPRPNLAWRYKLLQPRTLFINALVSGSEKRFFLNKLDVENSSSILERAQGLANSPEWYKKFIIETAPRIIQISDLQEEYEDLFSNGSNDIFSVLSIDVEGDQLDVLETIDWNHSWPSIILIEENMYRKELGYIFDVLEIIKQPSIQKLLRIGYEYIGGNSMTHYLMLKK